MSGAYIVSLSTVCPDAVSKGAEIEAITTASKSRLSVLVNVISELSVYVVSLKLSG